MKKTIVTISALTAMAGVAFAQTTTQSGKPPGQQSQAPQNQQGQQSQQPQAQQKQQAQQNQPSQAGQPGVRAVSQAGTVAVTFYSVQPADMRASKLIGTDVYNRNNENIGEVQDLIIDNGKILKAVVVSVGGFLGIGDRNVAVEPGSIVLTRQGDGAAPRIVINTTKEDLKRAPEFKFGDMDRGAAGTASSNTGATTGANTKPGENATTDRGDKMAPSTKK